MSTNVERREAGRQVLLLFVLMIFVGMAANLATIGMWQVFGYSADYMMSGQNLDLSERMIFRLGLMINHLGMFLLPAIIFGIIYYKRTYFHFLNLNRLPAFWPVAVWTIIVLMSYPLVGYLTQINEAIPLPDWAQSAQSDAFAILGNVLKMDSPWELLSAIVLVGILPALGEELIFRRVVQQKLSTIFQSDWVAIILASVLFGAIHFQLERILPLSILGCILGLSFYYTKSLITPIILHFVINGSQVAALYYSEGFEMSSIENSPDIPPLLAIASLILTLAALYYARSLSPDQPKHQNTKDP